jgi:flagellar biosynthesis protein FliP
MSRIGKIIALGFAILTVGSIANAQGVTLPTVSMGYKSVNDPQELVTNIKILLALTVLTLAPAILIMMTSFTRIIIVLSFVRQALGTQNMPPNQILVGLALFVTLFIMSPFLTTINNESIQPFLNGTIKQDEALDKALAPIRSFMFNQTRDADLALFVNLSKMTKPKTRADVPTQVLMPAFIVSELKTAFQIGFIIYLPFLVIDMIAASVLMAMGMMMLPPVIISLPFKIMLFVLVDGWTLIIGSLVKSFG